MVTTLWTIALALAVLWPSHALSPLDGVPLDGRLEAILIGVALPTLWWLDRRFLAKATTKIAILVLLFLKVTAFLALPQHGLCARFSTTPPFRGVGNTIPIDEPTGSLRSWDLRADWRSAAPRCTAVLDRPYRSTNELPAWFVNLLDFIRPGRRDLALDVSGYIGADAPGIFSLQAGRDMTVEGRVDGRVLISNGDRIAPVPLDAGTHSLVLHAAMHGDDWRLVPLWNGHDAWSVTRLTMSEPPRWDRALAGPIGLATTAAVLIICGVAMISALQALKMDTQLALWSIGATTIFAWLGAHGRFERFTGVLLLASVLLPIAARHRNLQGAFLLIGLPWMAFFVGRSLSDIGRFTQYSSDDWIIFQAAGYRIFLNGYWLEGGSRTFYNQPFYRWISGAIHLVFGDSSVGELYWDATCVVMMSLLAFQLVRVTSGFKAALLAGAAVLATISLGTTWYFIGRGMSEISAVGWLSLSAFMLLKARLGKVSNAVAAGVFATLMFYTRLNHLALGLLAVVLLAPLNTSTELKSAVAHLRRIRPRVVMAYVGTFAVGVTLFAARTWWFTGVFGLLHGTSFSAQETGLRLSTIGSPEVWAAVSESVRATLWMNEPPRADVRAALVVAGVLFAVAAVTQIPFFRRLPLAPVVLSLGGMLFAFIAHAHYYPGRLTIHLIPFTVSTSICTLTAGVRRWKMRASQAGEASGARDAPRVAGIGGGVMKQLLR